MRLAGTLVLVLCIGVFAGSAHAGNGNGNGNDGNQGKSADAPGQVKKEEAAAPAAPAPAAVAPAPAPEQQSAPAEAPSTTGVKPSNDTAKDTHEEASSDKTKLYGNGHNAGEIAIKNGAGPRTVVHGPGNSQPHKAAPCSGGHEVDVHALKAHNRLGACGGSPPAETPSSPPGTEPQQPRPPVSESRPAAPAATATPATPPPPAKPAPRDPAGKPAAGAVVESAETQGVLAATGTLARAELPFTGLPLFSAALLGLALLATGLAIRKFVASVESGHEHPTRPGRLRDGAPAPVRSRTGR
jgi:hypothetical protein